MMSTTGRVKKVNNYFDGLEITKRQLIVYAVIIFAFFFEQLDNSNMSFIAPALIKSWHVNQSVIANINSLFFLGMTFGGLFGGMISDFFGRRKAFLGSMLLAPLGSVIDGFTSNMTVFLLARVMTGFGILCLMTVAATYMSEITPKEKRGKIFNRVAAAGFLALPAVGFVGRGIIPMAPEAWRYVFFIGGIGIIPFIVGLIYLKESPRWLVNKGRITEAEEIVETLSGVAVDLSEAAKIVPTKVRVVQVLLGMFSKKYIKRSLMVLFAQSFNAVAILVIAFWVPTLLNQKGLSLQTSLTVGLLLQIGSPLGIFASSFVIDKGGRKIPLVAFMLACAATAFLFAQTAGASVAMAMVFGLLVSFLMNCQNFTLNTYVQEQFPTQMRNTSFGIAQAVSRFATTGSQLLIPFITAAYGFSGLFSIVALLFALAGLIILVLGQSTAGRSLEDIT